MRNYLKLISNKNEWGIIYYHGKFMICIRLFQSIFIYSIHLTYLLYKELSTLLKIMYLFFVVMVVGLWIIYDVCVCMCGWVYVCMCIYGSVLCVYVYVYVCECLFVCMCVCICGYIYVYLCVCKCMCECTTYTVRVCMHIHTCTQVVICA